MKHINKHDEERMDAKAQSNIAKLPEICHTAVPGEKFLCVIKRGERGYYRTDWQVGSDKMAEELAADRNSAMGLTPREVEAMEIGSMCGYHVPGADIDYNPKSQEDK